MPQDNRPTAPPAPSPVQFAQKTLTGDGKRSDREQFWKDLIDYGKGIFDNKPDQPGQPAARKKILTAPIELFAPTRIVKSLAELVGGSDLPPLVHRTEGGRGTGVYEREELERAENERRKADAEAERKRLQQRAPGVPIKVAPINTPNIPRSIVLGAYAAGIRYTLNAHLADGRALQLAALVRRVIWKGAPNADLAKSAIGHALVTKPGVIARRKLGPPGRLTIGDGINAAADGIDVAQIANIEGVDP